MSVVYSTGYETATSGWNVETGGTETLPKHPVKIESHPEPLGATSLIFFFTSALKTFFVKMGRQPKFVLEVLSRTALVCGRLSRVGCYVTRNDVSECAAEVGGKSTRSALREPCCEWQKELSWERVERSLAEWSGGCNN